MNPCAHKNIRDHRCSDCGADSEQMLIETEKRIVTLPCPKCGAASKELCRATADEPSMGTIRPAGTTRSAHYERYVVFYDAEEKTS